MVRAYSNFMSGNEAGAAEGAGELFPPRFWGLDPLFSAKVKLNIRDVLKLEPYPEFPGQQIYHRGGRGVRGGYLQVFTVLGTTQCWACT